MKENILKTKLKQGETVYGVLSPVYDPTVAEIVGHLGFDFYMLDCEHGSAGPVQAENVVRACETVGMTPLARVRNTEPKLILQFLDIGIIGVMMPSLTNADDVKQLVEAVKYPPLGKRGIAPVRANDYLLGPMLQGEYVPFSNEQTLVLPQIETVEAVNNLDSLLLVEGVDGFIVGPRDLSMSMGYHDGPAHEEVWSLVYRVFEVVRGAGLFVGTTASTAADAQRHVEHGARIILGSLNSLLKLGASGFLAANR